MTIELVEKRTHNSKTRHSDGWTISISTWDILIFNVDSCSAITRVMLSLKVTKS